MATQPHLPQISDEYIYLFLHACYYNIDKTKHTIECYFTIKSNTPLLFSDRNVYSERMKAVLELGHLIRLPSPTKEGYKVLMYTVKDPDYTKLIFSDAVKGFCMYNDCILSEDGLVEGYIVLFDMKGVSLGHLARVSLPALKAFMVYIQDAHPARLKGIHILNTANYINHVMRLITPLVRSEILTLVKFHKGVVPDGMDKDLLPLEYGGKAPRISDLDADTKSMIDDYAPWLIDSERYCVDESKRVRKASWWGLFNGTNPVPNQQQSIDKQKQVFFENLQID